MSETKTEDFEVAHRLAAGEKMLGWSSSHNPQGLVLPFFLGLLSGRATGALPPNLAQLWERGLRSSIGFWAFGGEREAQVFERLERAYTEQFAQVFLSNDSQEKILSWCLDVAHQRVNAIVGGQHRKSYGKAAMLTTACAETLRLRGDREAAGSLVNEVSQRFPRHRAFQAELKAAVQRMEQGLR
jgi:hypothetical protein